MKGLNQFKGKSSKLEILISYLRVVATAFKHAAKKNGIAGEAALANLPHLWHTACKSLHGYDSQSTRLLLLNDSLNPNEVFAVCFAMQVYSIPYIRIDSNLEELPDFEW
jgi:hypothetical protein